MKNNIFKIIILGAVGGMFLIWPVFSFSQSPQDFPMMEMTMSVDKEQARPGDFLNYAIYFRNVGHWTAYDMELEDSFPKGTSLESTSFHASNLSRSKIEYSLPDFVPGASQTIFLKLRVDDETKDGTILINKAVLSYGDGRQRTKYLVSAQSRSLLKTTLTTGQISKANEIMVPVAKAKEITAPVGSHALLVNLGLASLTAGFGVLIFYLVVRNRKKGLDPAPIED